MWEGWDDFRKIYPQVGTTRPTEEVENTHLDELRSSLLKLPRVHLMVLDALISHLKQLVESTTVEEETKELFINKLALSLGRTILRPKYETQLSIQDRHPTLLLMDLIQHYDEILPITISRKKRESETRPTPLRKRTRPTDLRLSRSGLSGGIEGGLDPQILLEMQLDRKGGRSRNASPNRVTQSKTTTGNNYTDQNSIKDVAGSPTQSPIPEITSIAAPPGDEELPSRPIKFIEPPVEGDGYEGSSPVSQSGTYPAPDRTPTQSPRPESPNSGNGSTSLKRHTSSESKIRGPRTARGPRPQSHVPGKPSLSANPEDYAPRKKGGSVAAGAFSRRTQESDAEDNILGR